MERILDLEGGFSIELFDGVVAAALSSFVDNKEEAEKVLLRFKELPGSWTKIDFILKNSEKQQSKFVALQILEDNVKVRWSLFSEEMRAGLRQYVFTTVIERAAHPPDIVLNKFNTVLIEIAKKDWPQKWSSFIADLITVSQSTSMAVARNTLKILQMMNEQIFEAEDGITTTRKRLLRATLQQEYFSIFRFISLVLKYSESQELDDQLLENCLNAFRSFCKSMPLEFVFNTEIVDHVLVHLNSPHSIAAIDCLLEIVELERGEFIGAEEHGLVVPGASPQTGPLAAARPSVSLDKISLIHNELLAFFKMYLEKFAEGEKLAGAYQRMGESERIFVRKYARIFAALYALWFNELDQERVHQGLGYLVEISKIDDANLFKTVFPMWAKFVYEMYTEYPLRVHTAQPLSRQRFAGVLQAMLPVFVQNMPKPEEVFVLLNDLGEVVKDRKVETAEIDFYRQMKSNLLFLSYLIEDFLKDYFIRKVEKHINMNTAGMDINAAYRSLSQICWAVGSLAGALEESEERNFFVSVINSLLTICEIRSRREEKAIIASSIMFIIGQYYRFLKFNNEFFFVVIRKLFEFMNETYEGIKEMACDNFFKICERCPNQFFVKRNGAYIIDTVIGEIGSVTCNLDFYLQRVVLEGFLTVIKNGPRKDIAYVRALYEMLTNHVVLTSAYIDGIHTAVNDRAQLMLASHVIESYALGFKIVPDLFVGFASLDTFLVFYAKCAESDSKGMQILKKGIAGLLEAAVCSNCVDHDALNKLCASVLVDYKVSHNPSLLALGAAIVENSGLSSTVDTSSIQRLQFFISGLIAPSIPYVAKADEHTDLSIAFYKFLTALVDNAFGIFFPLVMESQIFEPMVNAVLFSLTTLREISSLALQLLHKIYEACLANRIYFFFSRFLLVTLENLLGLIFDKDMKSSYSLQAGLLFFLVSSLNSIPSINNSGNNVAIVKEYVTGLFTKNFSNLTPNSINVFVEGLIEIKELGLFREHLDDFNVKVYEYGTDEDASAELELLKERVAKSNS
ncbi:exportin-1 [Pancytospora philotis]|nr:exportin-1 [Pancytospora philotis]